MRDEPEILEAEPVPPARSERAGAADLARTAWKTRRAWFVAIGADALQWGLFPLFVWGGFAPWNVGVDLVVAFLLTRWMGFHIAFLPAFVTELIPIANFIPSWTLALWIVTKLRAGKEA